MIFISNMSIRLESEHLIRQSIDIRRYIYQQKYNLHSIKMCPKLQRQESLSCYFI